MAVEALGKSSSTSQINFQVRAESNPQSAQAQEAKKAARSAQADTVSISTQALKLADDKSAAAKEEAKKADEQKALQLADDKAYAAKKAAQATQNNAVKAYAAFSASQ